MHRRISLTRYLVEKQHNDGRIPPELRLLLEVVARVGQQRITLVAGAKTARSTIFHFTILQIRR